MNFISTNESEKATLQIYADFFQNYPIERVQEELWFMFTSALKLDNEYIDREDRMNMIRFYENCIGFFKAVDLYYEGAPRVRKEK